MFRGQGMEFAEVRAYEPGDDFRSIDWNVSARLGSPYVKTFTEERELTLMLLVDQSGSTRFGEPVTKAALAVEVAAVLALAAALPERPGRRAALRRRGRAGDSAAEGPAPRAPGHPRSGRLRAGRDGAPTSAASLSYASRLLRHRSIVVVLSDFIAEGWERPLRRLAARHEVVAITVDDPREHELPESGWIEMLDAESGRRVLVDTGSRDVRDPRERAQPRSAARSGAAALAAAGADQVHLETGVPYALPLRRRVRARARGGSTADDVRRCPALQHGARPRWATRSGSAARSRCRPARRSAPADWDAAGADRAPGPAAR